mgnify:CR=1 FL=1
MKLAEALVLRKDMQTLISRLRDRLFSNVLVQDGDTPSEDPQELIARLEDTFQKLTELIARINKTNAQTLLESAPLSDAITKRDLMMRRISIMREVLKKAADRPDRYSRKEILLLTPLDVQEEEKKLDRLSYEVRLLDARIQAKNWEVELL